MERIGRRLATIAILLAVACGLAPAAAQAVVRRVWWQGKTEVKKGAPPLPVAIQGGTITVRLLSGPQAGEADLMQKGHRQERNLESRPCRLR